MRQTERATWQAMREAGQGARQGNPLGVGLASTTQHNSLLGSSSCTRVGARRRRAASRTTVSVKLHFQSKFCVDSSVKPSPLKPQSRMTDGVAGVIPLPAFRLAFFLSVFGTNLLQVSVINVALSRWLHTLTRSQDAECKFSYNCRRSPPSPPTLKLK